MIPLIIISGATATGKSKVALSLAEKICGEIISADSLQVYRYFNIGSDKPSLEILNRVRHHLIDIVDPDEEFNASCFNEFAYSAALDIYNRGKLPILCGGTGLYINALINNLSLGVIGDISTKKFLKDKFPEEDTKAIYEELLKLDPEAGKKIDRRDRYRIERALEVFYISGIPISIHHRITKNKKPRFEYKYFILAQQRDYLYRKIDKRVDNMVKRGLIDEVKEILEMGYSERLKPFKAIGYSQIISCLNGEMDINTAVEKIKRDTRRFAKRQLTWFRPVKQAIWMNLDNNYDYKYIADKIMKKSGFIEK